MNLFKTIKIFIIFLLIGFVACTQKVDSQNQVPVANAFAHVDDTTFMNASLGQLVYIPVYSHIPMSDKEVLSLRALLSVRNTSEKETLIISKIDYFDTNGKLLKSFLEKPISLAKMATFEVEISTHDLSGGTGANFIVKWEASNQISAPIIESLMYGAKGPQSYSFISRGQVVERH